MLEQPIFRNFSSGVYQFLLSAMIIIMYICVCAEADIYVPAFPQMIKYFGIAENQIQLVLSLNFLGLCVAGIIAGPLSDSYGRRKVILLGLALFMLTSIILVTMKSFEALLFWRVIQGISAAIPMVCAGAMLIDKYSGEKASQLIGMVNSVITSAMAAAPMLGAYLSEVYGWRANFIAVMLLSIVAFIGFLLFIEESLDLSLRRTFRIPLIIRDYTKLFRSLPFLCYVCISCLPFITIIVYITNMSVIFINHLGISLADYSYYQASTMTIFVLFSLSSVKLIAIKGVDFTKNLGGVLLLLGVSSLVSVSIMDHTSAILICVSMGLIAAGGSMMVGTFGMQALSIFPEMNGTALAACTAIRLFLIAFFIFISEIYFDGTIIPVTIIIASYSLFTGCFYIWILLNKRP